jgi:chromosome segregation protein
MVHIKRIELSHFKSFGGTTKIPILPGFTVVSGPNGSGKSNILDALLFCLGLATSKGMRAERLPDLVNHNQTGNNRTSETSVTVTFDLDEEDSSEWSVTRRLRVTKSGSYSSQFYINNEPCNASELHEQLNKLRIYPEGYNVVLQGDVTSIISMNSKERREIIDELAGVADFDRKINQAKSTLEAVKEREDSCKIIEQELVNNKERLATDKIKAEKYQKLKQNLHEKQGWEIVLIWKSLQQKIANIQIKIATDNGQITQLNSELDRLNLSIYQTNESLQQLNSKVKELGEEEQVSVASKLATQKAKYNQLQSHVQELEKNQTQLQGEISKITSEINQNKTKLTSLINQKNDLETRVIPLVNQDYQQLKDILNKNKEKAQQIASQSQQWLQEQTQLNHNITELQKNLNPKKTEQAQFTERNQQLENKISEQTSLLLLTENDLVEKQNDQEKINQTLSKLLEEIPTLTKQLNNAETDLNLQQETRNRLLKEQQEKQRQIDKLEATKQAQQEAQGTFATKIILQSQLRGVCGLVCQLGEVETRYQLALEIAAGSRLGCVVVENDEIGAIAIELLKQKRAGRATFLPLNKINPPRLIDTSPLKKAGGFIDLAVNLVNYESRYQPIFAYVFGNTVVFDKLDQARNYLGKYRIVTLNGEILESSGAMTGGSQPNKSSLTFGTSSNSESKEFVELRDRLGEIETVLAHSEAKIAQNSVIVKNLGQKLTEKRQEEREQKLYLQQLEKEIKRLSEQKDRLNLQLNTNRNELEKVNKRLGILGEEIPELELELGKFQGKLDELEAANSNEEWQEINALIKVQERDFEQLSTQLREKQAELKELENQESRLGEKIAENTQRLALQENQLEQLQNQQQIEREKLTVSEGKIQETEVILEQLNVKLKEIKQERDKTETLLKNLQNEQQNKTWHREKLEVQQQERAEELTHLHQQLAEQESELPDPLPEIPNLVNKEGSGVISFANFSEQLEQIQKEIKGLMKKIEALEPVNMLALEEYQHNEERLQELTEKLTTLEGERTELLLRIENFTTLRFQAFEEAFNAVNENFKTIFATLSEGDGHLQLENPENPFEGGLNLVAHPKGKPVQKLSSMSGGEKSLTALSFIFSLQRYRPSPFYAFDEVDMFLDGANVEKLAKMIKNQAQEAQFIVVSLRRPMIEASQRTIGVTQARGAYTQVLGIKL